MRILRVQKAFPLAATMLGLSVISSPAEVTTGTHSEQPLFQDLAQAQWKKMFPDLGDASPEIAILHVDPKTEATQLLIRTLKALHVRQHWHSANETHTMISGNATFAGEGNRVELGPGGFNYMPARMVHEAWTTAGSVVFITVDGPLGRQLGARSANFSRPHSLASYAANKNIMCRYPMIQPTR